MSGSSTGLDTKIAGLLCYLLGWVTGLIFLVIEKEDQDVRFHAYQSFITFGTISILSIGLQFVPFIGWFAAALLGPVGFILWVLLMLKAFQGERFKLPVAGDWAEDQL